MTEEMLASLEERNKFIPYRNGVKGQCKLTEVHAYAGEEYRDKFSPNTATLTGLTGSFSLISSFSCSTLTGSGLKA